MAAPTPPPVAALAVIPTPPPAPIASEPSTFQLGIKAFIIKPLQNITPEMSLRGIYQGVWKVAKCAGQLPVVKQGLALGKAIVNPALKKLSKAYGTSYKVGILTSAVGAKIAFLTAEVAKAPLSNLTPLTTLPANVCPASLPDWCGQYGEGVFNDGCTGPIVNGAVTLVSGLASAITTNTIEGINTIGSLGSSIGSNIPGLMPMAQTLHTIGNPIISTIGSVISSYPSISAGIVVYALFRIYHSKQMASYLDSIKKEWREESIQDQQKTAFLTKRDTFRTAHPSPTTEQIAATFRQDLLEHPEWMEHVPEFCASSTCLTSLLKSCEKSPKKDQEILAKNILEHQTALDTYAASAAPSEADTKDIGQLFKCLAAVDPKQIVDIIKKLTKLPNTCSLRNNVEFLNTFISVAPEELKKEVAQNILSFQQITTSTTIPMNEKKNFLIGLAKENPSVIAELIVSAQTLRPEPTIEFYVNLTKKIPNSALTDNTKSEIAQNLYTAIETSIPQPRHHDALIKLMTNLPELAHPLINNDTIPEALLESNTVMLAIAKIEPLKAWEMGKKIDLAYCNPEFVKACLIGAPQLYSQIPNAKEPDQDWLIEVVNEQPRLIEQMSSHKKSSDPQFFLDLLKKTENEALIKHIPANLLTSAFLLEATKIRPAILNEETIQQRFKKELHTPHFAQQLIDKHAQAIRYLPKELKTKPFLTTIMTNMVGINRSDVIQAISQDPDCLEVINEGLFSESQRAIATKGNPTLLLETLDPTSEEFKEIVITAARENPETFQTLKLDHISDEILIEAMIANQEYRNKISNYPFTIRDLFHILDARVGRTTDRALSARLTKIFSTSRRFLSGMAVYKPFVLNGSFNKVPHLTTNDKGFMLLVGQKNIKALEHLSATLKKDTMLFEELAKKHGNKVYDYADPSIDPRYLSFIRRIL